MTDYISDERMEGVTENVETLRHLCSWLDAKASESEDISYHYEAESVEWAINKIFSLEEALKEADPAIRADQMRKDAEWLESQGQEISLINPFELSNQLRAKSEQ